MIPMESGSGIELHPSRMMAFCYGESVVAAYTLPL
jgi:hypothetical protein